MTPQHPGEIILYTRAGGTPAIEVHTDGEPVCLSQQQIADLFRTSRTNVAKHIANIYAEGELTQESTCRKFRQVRIEGGREVTRNIPMYDLDVVISVGYRVKSRESTQFRIWTTRRLREYLVKGFTMDDERLKNLGGGTYWKELLERIRDIRSSEKVLYRQVLDLYATSVDYDPKSPESITFFKTVQNKLHYAAHGHTAAEDLVSAFFDAAEFRAQNHEPTYMADWLGHLDRLLIALEAKPLDNAGTISHDDAIAKAEAQHQLYLRHIADEPSEVERQYLEAIKQTQHQVEGKAKLRKR